jgi:RNA polymerase sigma-70 factor (ECF subfamily)
VQPDHSGRTGDQEAFAALFEQHKNLVYKTAYLMLGNPQDAEEALQEIFVLVYRSLPGYDPRKGAFTTWLYRVSMNYCLNQRRNRRVETRPLDEAEQAIAGRSNPVDTAERDAVREAIAGLGPDQRAVVILRYYFELPYQEIAEVIGAPLGTVKSRLERALRALRRMLEAQDAIIPERLSSSAEEIQI